MLLILSARLFFLECLQAIMRVFTSPTFPHPQPSLTGNASRQLSKIRISGEANNDNNILRWKTENPKPCAEDARLSQIMDNLKILQKVAGASPELRV